MIDLGQVKTTKFLGVLIDDTLTWRTHGHTTHVCKMISKYNHNPSLWFLAYIVW